MMPNWHQNSVYVITDKVIAIDFMCFNASIHFQLPLVKINLSTVSDNANTSITVISV